MSAVEKSTALTGAEVMISDLEIMLAANNYRQWMYSRIAPFIGQRVLEVGAGTGNFTELLLDRQPIVPTDKFASCVDYLKRRFSDHPRVLPSQLDLENPDNSRFESSSFDSVVCLNVLEHVENDSRALSFARRILAPGGHLVLLVPAFQFLYGSIDRKIEHHRRYTRKTLLPKMEAAGFGVVSSFYMNMIGIPAWFWNNRIMKIEEEDSTQIAFFDKYVAPWAERIERVFPPQFGLSLIAIGRK